MIGPTSTSRYARLRQRWVDRAALRMYERLAADPASYRSAPSTHVATGLALLVLASAALVLTVLVWATFNVSGVEWVPVVLGWMVVVVLRPRPARLPRSALVLPAHEYPGLHALVESMARAVGVTAPRTVAVDIDFNAYVMPIGFRGRPAMVLGLPFMTVLPWNARLGVIGHELGHLRGRDTARGRVVAGAMDVVAGVHYLLAPGEEDLHNTWDPDLEASGRLAEMVVRPILAVLAAPFLLLSVLLDRLALNARQHQEYLADRRAAEVVGNDAMVESLCLDVEGVTTAVGAAARRGEDPFADLAARPPLTSSNRAARLRELDRIPHRADATHPPDHLRIRLLDAEPRPPSPLMPTEVDCARAEQELITLRAAATKELTWLLKFGPHD